MRILVVAIVVLVIGSSLVSYAMMWLDKRAAERGAARIPERTLHIVELLGGWPGSWMGQAHFRHKTSKRRYRLVFWLCAIAHVVATATLLGIVARGV